MNSAAWPLVAMCGLFTILATCGMVGCGCGDDDDDSGGGGDDDASDDDATDDDSTDDDTTDDDVDDDASEGPTVTGVSPPDGATDQRLLTVVEVTFSEPMDAASVEGLFDAGGVAGAFAWDATGEVLTFAPDDTLDENTTYNLAIGAGALSQDGDAMAADATFAFTTVDLWTRTWNGAADDTDRGRGVATDGARNAYVAGLMESGGVEQQNMVFAMWNAAGDPIWSETFDGEEEQHDAAWGIASTGDGGFVVAGHIGQPDSDDLAALMRYDDARNIVWDITFDGADGGYNSANDVAVDAAGDVYAVGEIDVPDDFGNLWVGKYGADGDEDWFDTFNGGADDYDTALGIAVDADGFVYAVGSVVDPGEKANVWVRKYGPDGDEVWTRSFNNTDFDLDDEAHDVAVDAEGGVYVVGFTMVGLSDTDLWLRKYNADGDVEWTVTEAGSADGVDRGTGVAVGPDGALYVVGWLITSGTGSDILVRRYDPETGDEIWTDLVNYDGAEQAQDVAVDDAGNIYVVGEAPVTDEATNIWLRKYDPDGHWAE